MNIKTLPLCAAVLAILLTQPGSTQTHATAPSKVVDGVTVTYNTTYDLGCGLHLVPIPENLAKTRYFQNLGDSIQTRNGTCSPVSPLRATVFVIQSGEKLDVKLKIETKGIGLYEVDSVPKGTASETQAKQIADKINRRLNLIGLAIGRY